MIELDSILSDGVPAGWMVKPFWALFRRVKRTGYPDAELLSVYRDHGVVPKSSRDDNFNKESEDLSGYQLVQEGALVTNKMKAWQGSIAISRYRGIVSPAYYVYEPQSREHDQFLHYLLRSEPYIALYQRISKGIRVNQWDLEHEALRGVPVPLPPLPTQKAIADFLDRETARIDLLIEKKRALTENFALRRLATISSLTFDQDVQSQPLRRFFHVVTGKTPSRSDEDNFVSSGGMLWATPTDLLEDKAISSTSETISDVGMSGMKVVPAGTVLVNGIGASVGKVGLAGAEMTYNQQIHGLIPKSNIISSDFLLYVLIARRQEMLSLASLNTIPILNGERLGRVLIPVFDAPRQKQVVEVLKHNSAKIISLTEKTLSSIESLREFRAALITAAVTGQINPETWSRRGTTDRRLDQIAAEMGA